MGREVERERLARGSHLELAALLLHWLSPLVAWHWSQSCYQAFLGFIFLGLKLLAGGKEPAMDAAAKMQGNIGSESTS